MIALLHAEWTKLRTVRGWVAALALAAVMTVLLGAVVTGGSRTTCSNREVEITCPTNPIGPGGEAVSDKFFFVHQTLSGPGTLTARVTSLTGLITYPPPDHDQIVAGVVPWAKAGIMVKDGTRPGSTYAALMVTGAHGTRLQDNFIHDRAGRPGTVSADTPRWLRLVRTADVVAAEESDDGTRWTSVGTVVLPGLPESVEIGLFVASPSNLTLEPDEVGSPTAHSRLAKATAVFDRVSPPSSQRAPWIDDDIGAAAEPAGNFHHPGSVIRNQDAFTVTGNGDIAPVGGESGSPVERSLFGVLGGLLVLIVIAAQFAAVEYRRSLIRTSLTASPHRGRLLLAKALVLAAAAFVVGVTAAAIALPLGTWLLIAGGNQVLHAGFATELRLVVGTAVLLSLVAILALALGFVFRRPVAAVTTTTALVVLPYALALGSVFPPAVADWLLRITPAAGFAIQQSIPVYPQVIGTYVAALGYFPLPPWAGLAVLAGWTLGAVAVAAVRLNRGDA